MGRAPSAISDPERRTKWINAIKKIQDFESVHGQICACSRHFEQKDMTNTKNAVPSIFDPVEEISENCIDESTDGDNHHFTCKETELLLLKIKSYENRNAEIEIAKQKLILSKTKMKAAYEKELKKRHLLSEELNAAKVKIEKLERVIESFEKGKPVSAQNTDIENVMV